MHQEGLGVIARHFAPPRCRKLPSLELRPARRMGGQELIQALIKGPSPKLERLDFLSCMVTGAISFLAGKIKEGLWASLRSLDLRNGDLTGQDVSEL